MKGLPKHTIAWLLFCGSLAALGVGFRDQL